MPRGVKRAAECAGRATFTLVGIIIWMFPPSDKCIRA